MLDRPEIVHGVTYKLKPPIIEEAVYLTINSAEVNGQMRPVELFINSKNMDSFQWISLITRLVSAHMRTAGEFPHFVIEEMLETYDPHGGYFIPGTGVKVNSIVAHIGITLRDHCKKLGILPEEKEES
jgi:hypothetical protein